VNKRFRVCDLNQPFLISPSLQDWLPENHLARFVAEPGKPGTDGTFSDIF
jgi:putative transposase